MTFRLSYILFSFLLLGFTTRTNSEIKLSHSIIGHWTSISTGDSLLTIDDYIKSGKEITFKKIKYKLKYYQWGGGCYNGIEFTKDGGFSFYSNTLCSTESSPVSNNDETWTVKENIVTVNGDKRVFDMQIIKIDKKKLVAVFTSHK